MWTIALVAIIAAAAAVAAPYLAQMNDVDRITRTATILRTVAAGVDSFNATARTGVAFNNPNNLAQLTVTIVNGQTAGCTAQTYNATAVTNWATGAPYVTYSMPAAGLWTPIGRLNNLPSRTTATAGTARTANSDPYYIQIPNVHIKDARMLDLLIDGVINNAGATDTVLYTAVASDSTVLLSWNVFPAHMPSC